MTDLHANQFRQTGGVRKLLLSVIAIVAVAVVWLAMDKDAGKGLKKQAQLKTLEVIGDAAAKRLDFGDDSEGTHGSAVDLIKRPIEVRQVADNVY